MDISRDLSSRKVINVETVLLYLIQYATLLTAISYIMYFQAGVSAIWGSMIVYTRLLVCLLDIFFLLIHYFRRRAIPLAAVKVCLILLYVLFVAFFIFRPSTILVVSNGFPWPLTYLVFFSYTKEKKLPEGFKNAVVLCHLICCVVLIRTIQTQSMQDTNVGPVYHAIVYLPMILFVCNKKEKLMLSVFATLLVVASAKRTGFVALVAGFCGYFILTAQKGTLKKRIKSTVAILVGGAVCLVLVLYYIEASNSNILDRLASISEDGGSGRFEMWVEILSRFEASSTTKKLFGHGFHAVSNQIKPFGKYIMAHNSYIEYLYDLGIVGLGFLLFIVADMIRFLLRLMKEKSAFAPPTFFAMSIVLMFSLTSYFFDESNYIMMVAIYWGIARGTYLRAHSGKA